MSKRTDQVSQLLISEVNNIIVRDVELPRDSLVTLTRAEVAPDLKSATLFISVLPDTKQGSALAALQKTSGHIQHLLNRKLTMKFVPRISWEIDSGELKRRAVEDALNHS